MPQLILDSLTVSSSHTVVLFFERLCPPNTPQCPMGRVTQTHYGCRLKKAAQGGRDVDSVDSCGILVVLSSTSTRKPALINRL